MATAVLSSMIQGRQERAAEANAAAISEEKSEVKADLPHEIEVETDWAGLLDAQAPDPELQQIGGHEVWLLNLFSSDECARLLLAAEGHGFGRTNYPKAYRGNLRLLTTDAGFAEVVWSRLQELVPTELTLRSSADEVWDANGLNECWRLAKYHPGDRFMGHCDAAYERVRNMEMSMFTVNVYMNEGFDGGSTRFYFQGRQAEADFSVTPKVGLCLLFQQPPGKMYFHDGEQLSSGLKYLFRSDVMYRKREESGLTS